MTKIESSVKHIPHSIEAVYQRLSDCRNVEMLKSHLADNPQFMEQLQQYDGTFDANSIECTADSISVPLQGVGTISLSVAEREEQRVVKYVLAGVPIDANVWIQLLPEGDSGTALKLTLGYDLPIFMKPFLSGKLDKLPFAIDKIADTISTIPF